MEYKFTTANFQEEVLESSLPVLVDFYADWCGPCKMMAPIVAALAEKYDGRIKVGKINVDENDDVVGRFGIRNIPTVIFFKNGEMVDKIVGATSKDKFKEKVENLLK